MNLEIHEKMWQSTQKRITILIKEQEFDVLKKLVENLLLSKK